MMLQRCPVFILVLCVRSKDDLAEDLTHGHLSRTCGTSSSRGGWVALGLLLPHKRNEELQVPLSYAHSQLRPQSRPILALKIFFASVLQGYESYSYGPACLSSAFFLLCLFRSRFRSRVPHYHTSLIHTTLVTGRDVSGGRITHRLPHIHMSTFHAMLLHDGGRNWASGDVIQLKSCRSRWER